MELSAREELFLLPPVRLMLYSMFSQIPHALVKSLLLKVRVYPWKGQSAESMTYRYHLVNVSWSRTKSWLWKAAVIIALSKHIDSVWYLTRFSAFPLGSLVIGKELFLPTPEVVMLLSLSSEIPYLSSWILVALLQKGYSLTWKGLVYSEQMALCRTTGWTSQSLKSS